MDVFEIIQDVLCLTLFGTEIVEMADDLSHLLFSFASYSNFYAIVTILFCFITTAVLILRFNNDLLHFQMIAPPTPNTAQKRSMTGFKNPFSIQLKDANSANLKDGFSLSVSSLSDGSLSVFWGASINVIHDILQWPAQTILDHAGTGQLLQDGDECLSRQEDVSLVRGQKEIHLDCPEDVTDQSLGSSPRQRYPVVVIATEARTSSDDSPRTVIANFTMLHLKDSIVTQQSHIVGQFLKLSDDRVFNLKPVYVATDNDSLSPSTVTSNTTSSTTSQQSESTACGKTSVGSCNSEDILNIDLQGAESSNVCDSKKHESKDKREMSLPQTSDTNPVESVQENGVESDNTNITYSTLNSKDECQMLNAHDNLNNMDVMKLLSDSSNSATDVQQLNCEQELSSVSSPVQQSHSRTEPSFSTGHTENSIHDSVSDSHLDPNGPECVVCQMNSISHVLLPCRHACICGLCFKKIDKCPMCRGYIESYFTLNAEDDSESDADVEEQAEELDNGFVAWFMNLNDQLNDYLGFT